jgi:hypothetical protein
MAQRHKNLQKEKESNQVILDNYITVAKRIKLNEHSMFEKITLDVGGRVFSTSKETLMRFEGSYFYEMLNSGNFLPGPDGSYFIDRDPTHFGLIMLFLRTGELSKKGLKSWEIEDLETELDYYLLHIPEEVKLNDWQWDLSPSKEPENATFSDDNLKITKSSGGGDWNCPAIGSSPVSEFTVQIISGQSIRIGLCPIEQFKQNRYHYNLSNGCLFRAWDGGVYYNGQSKSYSSKLKVNDKLTVIKTGTSI